MSTYFTYLKTSLLCILIGHRFKRMFVDIHTMVIGDKLHTMTEVEYHQCKYCRTRQAMLTGEYNLAVINFTWLREHLDPKPKALHMQFFGRARRAQHDGR